MQKSIQKPIQSTEPKLEQKTARKLNGAADALRRQFPLLAQHQHLPAAEAGRDLQTQFAYLDNAATTQKPHAVLEVLERFYRSSNSNVHRGLYPLSSEATELYEAARETVASFLKTSANLVIFTGGTTASLNQLSLGIEHAIQRDDLILVTGLEHHSNLLPWMRLAERSGAVLAWLPISKDGELDRARFRELLSSGRVKIVAAAGQSHVLGNILPIRDLFAEAQLHGAWTVLDAAQSITRSEKIFEAHCCDAIVFSGHKVYAPTGIGILALSPRLIEVLRPANVGGGMVAKVERANSFAQIIWQDVPHCFEAGTPPIEAAVALAEALRFVQSDLYLEAAGKEDEVIEAIALQIAVRPDAELFGWARTFVRGERTSAPEHGGILSFSLHGHHPHDIAQIFADAGVCVRAGAHCAQPLMAELGVSGCVRVSLAPYNTQTDAELFLRVLRTIPVLVDSATIPSVLSAQAAGNRGATQMTEAP